MALVLQVKVRPQARESRLEDAGDGNHNDHADWADAKLLRQR